MKVKIIADKYDGRYKGQIHEADRRPRYVSFPYRIKLDDLWTYWRDSDVEEVKDETR